jgi:hypothetical protein
LAAEATHLTLNGQVATGINDQWNTVSGGKNFASSYLDPQSLTIRFEGKDGGFWAGLYGPEVKNVSLTANYSVDLCALNPLYASHCAGFNDIVSSNNLVSNPGAIATWGQGLNQTFNIATALEHSGSGVMVHGINYGLDAYIGNNYCAWSDPIFGICFDDRDPDLSVNVNLKDSLGNSLYSVYRKGEYDNKPYWQTYNYSYVLPQSRNSLTLGDFEFTAQTKDMAGVMNMYANVLYTRDPCMEDPLFSASCPGYYEALQALIPAMSPAAAEPVAVADTSPTASTADPVVQASNPVSQAQTPAAAGSQTAAASEPTTTVAATQSAPQQTASAAPAESQSSQQKKSGPSLSQIQSIVANELSRISQVEQKTVAEAVAQAETASQAVTQQAESVAATAVSQSIEIGAASAASSQQQISLTAQNISQTTTVITTTQRTQSVQTIDMLQVNRSDSSSSPNQVMAISTSDMSQQSTVNKEQSVSQTFSQPINRLETEIIKESEQPQLSQPMANNIEVNNRVESEVSKENDQTQSLQTVTVTKNETTSQTQNIETSQPTVQTFTILPPAQVISQDIPQIVTQEQIIENRPFRVNAATFDREPNVIADKEEKQESNPLYSLLPPQQPQQVSIPEIETTKTELSAVSATPVVTEAAEKTPVVEMQASVSSGPSVNRSAPNNEAAGGVDIAMIASQPKGYEAYTIGIADRPFYEPKEIYKGQKTVDNMRAVRFLNAASDKLHQELVDMQYKGDK